MIGLLDHIFLINLDTRPDRLIHAVDEFSKINKTFERFPAIKNEQGHIGCTLSHIHCLENAKKRGLPHIFIAEDDITFTNHDLFLQNIKKLEESSNNGLWDVLIVGGNNCPPYQPITDYLVRVYNIQTTTGYIVKSKYYDTLIANMKEGLGKLLREPENKKLYAIDIYWKNLQKTDMWFFIVPPTVVQYADYSDIEKKEVDYCNLMLDLDKEELMRRYQSLFGAATNPKLRMNMQL